MQAKILLKKLYLQTRHLVPAQVLYHPDHFRVLKMLRQAEQDPLTAKRLQDSRLRRLMVTALSQVPFYQDTVRISENDLRNEAPRQLLEAFPLIDRSMLMAQPRAFLNRRYKEVMLHKAVSSGSSGEGIAVWRNKRIADIEKAFFNHEWGRLNFSMERSPMIRIGQDSSAGPDDPPIRLMGRRLMLSPFHINERWFEQIRAQVEAQRPRYVHGYPSCLAILADLAGQHGWHYPMDGILLASEPVHQYQLEKIAKVFGHNISVNYGLTERSNIGFARWDGQRLGPYRFDDLYAVNEFIPTDLGTEIVGTSLWNDVHVLIRYRTQDYAQLDQHTVVGIEGRSQDYLVTRDGSKVVGLVVDELDWAVVEQCQVRQSTPGDITLALVLKDPQLGSDARRAIVDEQKARWERWFNVDVIFEQDIPRSASGKQRFVLVQT